MNRNFDRFEVDHWYVYTGTKRLTTWSSDGSMDFVLSHNAVKCTTSDRTCASFKRCVYYWGEGFDNWIEVEDPTIAHSITSGEYYYGRLSKTIREYDCCASGNIGSNSNSHYKLSRPPYGESKMENKKEEFTPKKVKLSDNDDIWIECARYEELPCECYVAYYDNKLNIFAQRQNLIKVANINYGLPREYDGYLYAIPKTRADEALKFVCNVKIPDLKPGVKVKIKEDAEWMEKYNPTSFKKGGIYTVESTDNNDWGMWSDTIKGAVTLKESEDYRFPIHWIEKIVEDVESNLFGINMHRSSAKIKISELKNKTDYAVYVKSNEERIKFMSAVGKNWNNGYGIEVNKCSYPNYLTIRHDNSGILHTGGSTITDLTIYYMSDIDFEEDKVYIKGTDFYIGEKVRVKNIKDIKFKQDQVMPILSYREYVTIEKNVEESLNRYNCYVIEHVGRWHTDWFEHIDEKNVLDACLKVEVKGRCLNTKLFEELFIYPKHKTKYIKLNKNPIKKVKEYKVHKQEYIALNKK